MSFGSVVAIAAAIFGYALVSERLAKWSVSGPLVFVAAGLALGPSGLAVIGGDFDTGGVEVLAEVTLVLILFVDATRIDLRVLRRQLAIPARLLGIGLPLTVAAGTGAAVVLFSEVTVFEGALIAAILAPTDAALGQAVVSNRRVPVRIRQGLNVESGLNDGLMLPAITVLTALAASEAGLLTTGQWVEFVVRQVGFGVLFGVAIGTVGGYTLDRFVSKGWVEGGLRQIATLTVAVAAFGAAELADGNGFVAAFIAGLAFGHIAQDHCDTAADFTEDQGQLLALLTFMFFGALLVGPRLSELTPQIAIYVVLSLTALRMIPVAVSLIGLGLELPTVGYLGWFGPRGLASILFGLFVVEHADLPHAELMLTVVTWTVLVSVVAHGLSASPLAERYGRWWNSMTPQQVAAMPEGEEVEEMRSRLSM